MYSIGDYIIVNNKYFGKIVDVESYGYILKVDNNRFYKDPYVALIEKYKNKNTGLLLVTKKDIITDYNKLLDFHSQFVKKELDFDLDDYVTKKYNIYKHKMMF